MNAFAGFRPLLRLNLRRDRLLLPAYVVLFASVAGGSAAATVGVYPDEVSRRAGADLINATPALVAMYGRIYDPASLGAVSVIKLTGMGTALVALVAMLVVIRHTRADEEVGRYELLAAGAIGRFAFLGAAVATAAIGSVGIGVGTAAALVVAGLPAAGAAAFGLGWTVAGLAFAGVGAVAAQLTASARAARGMGIAALGAAFLLRAIGDTSGQESGWPTWLSPIGWAQQIRPFAGDQWAVALLPLAFGLTSALAAGLLQERRDLGAGVLPPRPGPRQAARWLAGPLALAWRLQRTAIFAWLGVFVVMSLAVGQILSNVGDMVNTPVAVRFITILGGVEGLTDAFLGVELSFVAVAAACYGISTTLRLVTEESAGRADLILATPVTRTRWAASHLAVAFAGSTALMLSCGLTIGLAQALQGGGTGAIGTDLLAAVVRLPAAWVLIGATVALFGLSRRAAPYGWGLLTATFLASELGPLIDLPGWVQNLSPFTYLPHFPGSEVTIGPLLGLLAVAVALTAVGLGALRRRDVLAG